MPRALRASCSAPDVRRELPDGFELDDDPGRVDGDAVFAYLSGESYWAKGRTRDQIDSAIAASARVVSLYRGERQIGFARVLTDGVAMAYLADVYVLPEFQGRGLGVELVRETVENGPYAGLRWVLRTGDAHGLYRRFGFGDPTPETMERPS
jgi:GNAT superfamily N-acetyltransferase